MRYLLDTHTLIWFSSADKELSETAKTTIDDLANSVCYLSIANFWEIAIKSSIGKLELRYSLTEYKQLAEKNNFEILPITFENTLIVSSLPLLHRDPFDRILIAQAMEENLTVITRDKNFRLYKNINLLW